MAAPETDTFTIEAPDGETESLELPAGALDLFGEGDETPPEILGDLAMLSLAQQLHAVIHHGHGEADPEVEAIEEAAMELFEERFGRSYAEMTGHSH